MPKTDRPLTTDERASITGFMHKALKKIGADRASAPDPDKLQQLISQALDMYRKLDDEQRESAIIDVSVALGSLWGQVICDQMGWTWVLVKMEDENEYYGVVTPNRSHLIFPLNFISDLIDDPKREQCSLTLYAAIRNGELPESSERKYVVLGSND